MHETQQCQCTDLKPLHMFVSGVGGTGKSFLIKTIRALVSSMWASETQSTLCAVTAPTGLAAFNVGGVTIHRLLQLPIEHESRGAGYWKLAKEALKVMRASLSNLKVLIIDEVSMVSSLNLAYIHLRLDEIFARDEWFGGVNVLFVGDILQLPPVNGAAVFERVSNKSVMTKLGSMTSVNIWQENVVYDELTINERQKKDQVFSSMLDEVRRGCPSDTTVQALKDRVITKPIVDKFEELLSSNMSPLCLFPTRKSCQELNAEMLSRLGSETKDIPCIDEFDETKGTFKWSEKAENSLKKMNSDCNLTAGLEAVLQVAVGARVMLRRNIDTSTGLVNGAVGTVIAIAAHHITVQFDGRPEPHRVERVKSRFMLLKKVFVHRKQFPLILAFAVTVHKCQGLSLDCAIVDLSEKVFCAGMAYVALSRVKQLQNLHLVAFQEEAIKVSCKCLQEINRLRRIYRPDLPQYTVSQQCKTQKKKRTLTGVLEAEAPIAKRSKTNLNTEGSTGCSNSKKQLPLVKRKKRTLTDVLEAEAPIAKRSKKDLDTERSTGCSNSRKKLPQQKGKSASTAVSRPTLSRPTVSRSILSRYRYNPISVGLQHQICRQLGLSFVHENRCSPGGAEVQLKTPTSIKHIQGGGNCLFRALSYVITGCESQHREVRRHITQHLLNEPNCRRLLENYIPEYSTLEEYIQHTHMDREGVWGTTTELLAFCHMASVNIASYNTDEGSYHVLGPGVIEPDRFPQDDSRPTIYIVFTGGNHFNVTLSQD